MDKFGVAGAVFYWGVLALFLKRTAILEHGLLWPFLVLLVVLPLLAVVLKEPLQYALSRRAGHTPHAGSLLEAILESAIEAFEAVMAYMANTISFVRLAAYAMAHAAVLMAAFMMAKEISKVSETFGGVLSVLIIILGNAVAIILEGIIAAVQALRLEYYEFFGKFFSGSGKAFKPFRFPAGRQGLSPRQ
jgi:V/A-type H+-transporting ATPase subunit I